MGEIGCGGDVVRVWGLRGGLRVERRRKFGRVRDDGEC